MINPEVPYNELPMLPPKADCETPAIMKQLVAAARALAELKGVANLLPAQDILINTISISEARSSSEIENVITTNDELYRAMLNNDDKADSATKEVLRYKDALWSGFAQLENKQRITTKMLINIVQTITQNYTGIRNHPGTKIENVVNKTMVYTPPDGEEIIREKLFNLEQYINATQPPDPLIKMAIIHYQFEAIHPFFDGNGRTGRILNILYLVKENLLNLPILFMSKYITDHKTEYYRKLNAVTTHDKWEGWIIFMLTALEMTAKDTRQKAIAIQNLMDETIALCKKQLPPNVYSKELVELIFRQPYTKTQNLVKAGIAERLTAAKYLKELEKAGVLQVWKVWKENIYINTRLYDLLTKN